MCVWHRSRIPSQILTKLIMRAHPVTGTLFLLCYILVLGCSTAVTASAAAATATTADRVSRVRPVCFSLGCPDSRGGGGALLLHRRNCTQHPVQLRT